MAQIITRPNFEENERRLQQEVNANAERVNAYVNALLVLMRTDLRPTSPLLAEPDVATRNARAPFEALHRTMMQQSAELERHMQRAGFR